MRHIITMTLFFSLMSINLNAKVMEDASDSILYGQNLEVSSNANIIEGDIKISKNRSVSKDGDRWKDNTIPYKFESNVSNATKQMVLDAIKYIESKTYVKFIQRSSQNNYINIISDEEACWSYVGMIGGKQELNVVHSCGKGSTIHEFSHALGLWHEQSREDRDNYVTIHWNNIKEADDEFDYKQNFTREIKYSSDIGPYDFSSIMHYGKYYFSKNGKPTITTKNGESIGQRRGYSRGDILAINKMYPELTAIGVIPQTTTCPGERITIHMDDEDWGNGNRHRGWMGAISQGRNTTFRFCKVSGKNFKSLDTYDNYAVLRLGKQCPNGSIPFVRYFDNEDYGNGNWSQGNIYPNKSNRDTTLYFCLFKGKGAGASNTMSSFPNIGIRYGVFTPSNFSKAIQKGHIRIDDEDFRNRDRHYTNDEASKSIVYGGSNTSINLSRVREIQKPKENPYAESSIDEKDNETEDNQTIGILNIGRVK